MSTQTSTTTPRRLLRLPEVLSIIGLKRSWWFNEIREGRGVRPIKVGRASCWDSVEVENFVTTLITQRGASAQPVGRQGLELEGQPSLRRSGKRGSVQ